MRILVYPHAMELSGSQINAIQLAGAVRDRGHEVIVLSEPGPLVERVRALGLEHVALPLDRSRPSPTAILALRRLAARRRIDVVHGYEWPPIIEALLAVGFSRRVAVAGTVMAMPVAPFLPRLPPLAVGAAQIRKSALARGHRRVALIEPPVDTGADHPGADIVVGQGGSALRGMAYGKPLVVVGEQGFVETLAPATAPLFLRQGWYGLGPGSLGAGAPALSRALEALARSEEARRALGAFARNLVVERFSLDRAAALQEQEYLAALTERIAPAPLAADLARSLSLLAASKLRRKAQRWRGTVAVDDTNALAAVAAVLRR